MYKHLYITGIGGMAKGIADGQAGGPANCQMAGRLNGRWKAEGLKVRWTDG